MLELASHIVKTKAGHFEPSKFEDQYEDALKAGTVSLALSTHLPSPGGDPDQYEGDPDQYEEEQSGKHPLKDAVEGDDGGVRGVITSAITDLRFIARSVSPNEAD
jgi:DNA end-binding protein Ku